MPKKSQSKTDAHIKRLAAQSANRAIARTSEHKHYENTAFINSGSSTSVGVAQMTAIPQSSTGAQSDNTRVGDVVKITSFQFRFGLKLADDYNLVRIIFFQWLSDSTPVGSDILLSTSYPLYSPYTADNRNLYKILYDRTVVLDANKPVVYEHKFLSRGFVKKMHWTAGSATAGSNHIWYLNVSDSGAISHPAVELFTRVNYIDN